MKTPAAPKSASSATPPTQRAGVESPPVQAMSPSPPVTVKVSLGSPHSPSLTVRPSPSRVVSTKYSKVSVVIAAGVNRVLSISRFSTIPPAGGSLVHSKTWVSAVHASVTGTMTLAAVTIHEAAHVAEFEFDLDVSAFGAIDAEVSAREAFADCAAAALTPSPTHYVECPPDWQSHALDVLESAGD